MLTCHKIAKFGFTLIELLVVLAIISVMSVIAYSSVKDLKPDQDLKSAVLDLQGFLKLGQSSALSALQCQGVAGVLWQVQINKDNSSVTLSCQKSGDPASYLQKTLDLKNNIQVTSIGDLSQCTGYTISYQATTNQISFQGAPAPRCSSSVSSIDVVLTNPVNGAIKTLTVTSTGAVNVSK